ncbi:hypothetical protein LJC59_04245 [Desulfovibrio sp. OttesenSCG-928-A18]|nr:hypothetical protein [Desulfovibrio sp. OttesenSCG-928-A18]
MTISKPGEYITARCGRCDDITGHVVMLVLDGIITKVECKACGSVHKYRQAKSPPKTGERKTSVRKVRSGESREQAREISSPATGSGQRRATQKSAAAPRRSSAAKLELAWQEAMLRHSGEEALPYSMQGDFQVGSLIEHSLFGKGEVIKVTAPDKMEVLFQEGVKVLRCKLS